MIHFSRTAHKPRYTLDDCVGILPLFFDERDPRTAQAQLQNSPGGPWSNNKSKWTFDPLTQKIKYPGDPAMLPLATAKLHDQTILVYESAWVVILEADGSWEIDRRD